jgi:hypothetical protein
MFFCFSLPGKRIAEVIPLNVSIKYGGIHKFWIHSLVFQLFLPFFLKTSCQIQYDFIKLQVKITWRDTHYICNFYENISITNTLSERRRVQFLYSSSWIGENPGPGPSVLAPVSPEWVGWSRKTLSLTHSSLTQAESSMLSFNHPVPFPKV